MMAPKKDGQPTSTGLENTEEIQGVTLENNGSGSIPPTSEQVFLGNLDNNDGRLPSPSDKYMRVSINKPERLWAETYFASLRDFARARRIAIRNQMDRGFLDPDANLLTGLVGRLAVKGYAREQAMAVDMSQKAQQRAMETVARGINLDGRRK